MAEISLEGLLEAQRADYDANFSHIDHKVVCDEAPSASIRLHFVRADASGQPRFRELARLLVRYITVYCGRAERRKDLPELQRNEMFMQCRDLFVPLKDSGQVGELLIYFLLETVLYAPQALKKMPMTTNPNEERIRWGAFHKLDCYFPALSDPTPRSYFDCSGVKEKASISSSISAPLLRTSLTSIP